MALSSTALTRLVLADYFLAFPQAVAVVRSNATTSVTPHNPPSEMVSAICAGTVNAMTAMVVRDAYGGVSGPGSAIAVLAKPVFNPGVVTSSTATLMATLGWTGPYAASLAGVLVSSLFTRIASVTSIALPPLVGAGAGAGVVSPAVNPTLSTAMTTAASTAILSEFTSSGYFAINDIPGNAVTPQVAALVTALSVAYGAVVGSVTAATVYTGPATTTPLSLTNTGKFT